MDQAGVIHTVLNEHFRDGAFEPADPARDADQAMQVVHPHSDGRQVWTIEFLENAIPRISLHDNILKLKPVNVTNRNFGSNKNAALVHLTGDCDACAPGDGRIP